MMRTYNKAEPDDEGHGNEFTTPVAKVGLVLWFLHPRKGAARGVRVQEIARGDVPAVMAYLARAAARNADRFAKIVCDFDD